MALGRVGKTDAGRQALRGDETEGVNLNSRGCSCTSHTASECDRVLKFKAEGLQRSITEGAGTV